MLGGALEIIGLIALLVGACELVARWLADRSAAAELKRQREALGEYPPAGDPWPRLEPELELLRRKAGL